VYEACIRYTHNMFVMPQCMHLGKNLIMQSLILIGATDIAKFHPGWRIRGHVGNIYLRDKHGKVDGRV